MGLTMISTKATETIRKYGEAAVRAAHDMQRDGDRIRSTDELKRLAGLPRNTKGQTIERLIWAGRELAREEGRVAIY